MRHALIMTHFASLFTCFTSVTLRGYFSLVVCQLFDNDKRFKNKSKKPDGINENNENMRKTTRFALGRIYAHFQNKTFFLYIQKKALFIEANR